jgi:hypothetical protein
MANTRTGSNTRSARRRGLRSKYYAQLLFIVFHVTTQLQKSQARSCFSTYFEWALSASIRGFQTCRRIWASEKRVFFSFQNRPNSYSGRDEVRFYRKTSAGARGAAEMVRGSRLLSLLSIVMDGAGICGAALPDFGRGEW